MRPPPLPRPPSPLPISAPSPCCLPQPPLRPQPRAAPRSPPQPAHPATTDVRPDAVLVFCALGTVAFFYNFVALAFIQATSALAIMIAGNFKHVLLIIMPLVLYDHDPSHALGWTHVIGISIFFLSLAWCTAIDVYNVWTAEEKPAGSGAAPTESSPLNREEQGGKGKVVEDSTAWTVPCLPGAPPRTVTGDKAA